MGQGRQVPKLDDFTFPDSGITVQLRKVSPLLRDDVDAAVRRQNPPPDPPMQVVDTGFGDGATPQPNPADPAYRAAVLEWQTAHWGRVAEALLRLAVARYIEVDVDQEAVETLRADMAALGVDLDADDKYVYITRICIGSRADERDLSNALFTRQEQLREAVDSHKATFRGDLAGQEHLAGQDGAQPPGI